MFFTGGHGAIDESKKDKFKRVVFDCIGLRGNKITCELDDDRTNFSVTQRLFIKASLEEEIRRLKTENTELKKRLDHHEDGHEEKKIKFK